MSNVPAVSATGWSRRLSSLTPVDRQSLLDRAALAAAVSERWLVDYPIVRRDSVTDACALAAAVAMPGLDIPEMAPLTRWWLWIFGVDDRFDDLAVPDGAVVAWPSSSRRR
jgi:hypothetical protein